MTKIRAGLGMENKNDVIALIHDLKNPLVAIERLSERILDNNASLSDDCRHKIRLVYDSAVQAVERIEKHNLSCLTEPGEEAGCHSFTAVDIRELAEEVVDSFRSHAESKHQTLKGDSTSDSNAEDCVVVGDPVQLREAMNALVSNAIKYSPPGETIRVHVRRHDDRVCFSVQDNGPGLSEEAQRCIFEPFQQMGPEPTGEESSTGVGLYIAQWIVDQHDGTIEVESRQGRGSTFSLYIPATASADDLIPPGSEEVNNSEPSVLPQSS